MFKQGLSIMFTVLSLQCVGQNLVPNGSFENYTACPSNPGEIYLATPWFQTYIVNGNVTYSSTDYFHQCSPSPSFQVPANSYAGFQYANTGSAYAGIGIYGTAGPSNYREYVEVKLLSPLVAGKRYCVEFQVSLAESSMYGCDKIGALLTSDTVGSNSLETLISANPQINNTNGVITDTISWVQISGEFIANGGEQFITIGNFYDNANTSSQMVNNNSTSYFAYYYIDDVSVTCCDPSGTCTLSLPEPPAIPFSIPTLLSTNDVFFIQGVDAPVNLTLYDARGRLVYKNAQYINDLPLVSYAEGIYFYVITLADGRTERGKLVIGK